MGGAPGGQIAKLNYQDYLAIPDDGRRHEILDGEEFVSPAPRVSHQILSARLHLRLGAFAEPRGLGLVLAAPVDVILSPHDVAQPDLVFVARARFAIVHDRAIEGAPDLAIEIISASSRRADEVVKRDRYQAAGIGEFWLVDPEAEAVRVLRLAASGDRYSPPQTLAAAQDDSLRSPLFPGLALPLRELFADPILP